jgi:hypothetical protein
MEIVKLINGTYQLIDHEGTVIIQGSIETCVDRLAEIVQDEETESYAAFLGIAGI